MSQASYLHIIQSKISQERSKIMNFYKSSYQLIFLRYLYTKTIKRLTEISLHNPFKKSLIPTYCPTSPLPPIWGITLMGTLWKYNHVHNTELSTYKRHTICFISLLCTDQFETLTSPPPPPGRPWKFGNQILSGSREFDCVSDGAGNLNRKYIRLNRKYIRLNRKCPFVRAKTENGGSYSIF